MVWVLSNAVEDTPLQQFFSLDSFESTFSVIILIDKQYNYVVGISFTFHAAVAKKKKHASSITRILQIRNTTEKNELTE